LEICENCGQTTVYMDFGGKKSCASAAFVGQIRGFAAFFAQILQI